MMKTFKKAASKIIVVLLSVLMCLGLTSCGEKTEFGRTFLVYYINADGDDIIYKNYTVQDTENMSSEELIQLLLDRMFTKPNDEEPYFVAKPADVKLNGFMIEDNLVTFDFDENYQNMTKVQEILLRAAVVLTVIQVPDISRVVFNIEGEPLTDNEGHPIGTMNADGFVNVLLSEEGMLKQETDLTLFFTDESGTKLIPAKYHFTIKNNNLSMEEYIIQQLKAGPAIGSTYRTISQDVKILSVVTSDYVCYVNFESDFLEQEQPSSDEILIYSIVNSLCCLPYVRSVQFLVEGSSDVYLHTVTDLSKPFSRNRSLEQ